RNEVDAERPRRARFGLGNLVIEQLRAHRPASDHAKAPGVRDGGHEMPFRNPAHRTAHDGDLGPEQLDPAMHQLLQARVPGRAVNCARFGDQSLAAHAAAFSSRPNALWRTRTASSASASAIKTLTLISLVETASRLICRSAKTSNIFAASPGFERMPTPTMLTLATRSSSVIAEKPISSRRCSITAKA